MIGQLSTALKNALLATGSVRAQLNGGFLYIFAGPVPATADDALDMVSTHTQLVKLSANDPAVADGATGLTFEATPSGGTMPKTSAQLWQAIIDNSGASVAATNTATFFRFCAPGDNGRAAGGASTYRIQGTVGTAGANLLVGSTSLTDNGTNTFALSVANLYVP